MTSLPSLVFTSLLDLSPEFGALPVEASAPLVAVVSDAVKGKPNIYQAVRDYLRVHPIKEA